MAQITREEVFALEEELRQAEMSVDRKALEAFFADDVMVTAPIGVVVDKAAVMDEVEVATKVKILDFSKEDVQVRIFGDTVVTSYRVRAKAEHEGVKIDETFRMSNVWLKRDGRWQVAARHVARLEQPKTERREGS
jgi:ketosteroid isomerase-like protein